MNPDSTENKGYTKQSIIRLQPVNKRSWTSIYQKQVWTQYFVWHNHVLDTVICWTNCNLRICLILQFQVLDPFSHF